MSEKNNVLIACFMGMSPTNTGDWCDYEEVLNFQLRGNTYHELWFESSWDWLIPVLKKIREIVNRDLSINDFYENKGLEQRLNPYDYDIDSVYKGAVEFIKYYVLERSNWYNKTLIWHNNQLKENE